MGLLAKFIDNDRCFRELLEFLHQSETLYLTLAGVSNQLVLKIKSLLYTGECYLLAESDYNEMTNILLQLGISLDLNLQSCSVTAKDISFNSNSDSLDNLVSEPFQKDFFIELNLSQSDNSQTNFQSLVSLSWSNDSNGPPSPGLSCPHVESYCSKRCKRKCHDIVDSWTEDFKVNFLESFQKIDTLPEKKTYLLGHLTSQYNLGISTSNYYVNGHQFCLGTMSNLTGLSIKILRMVLHDHSTGIQKYFHGNSGMFRGLTEATVNFISWLKQFVSFYGQESPDTNQVVLSYWLNKSALFKIYKDETYSPQLAKSSFYRNMRKYFGAKRVDKNLPFVKISKYSRKCFEMLSIILVWLFSTLRHINSTSSVLFREYMNSSRYFPWLEIQYEYIVCILK